MSIIDDIRTDHEDLAKVLKKHTGIRRTVEDLYPDNAHFIYELLQNAEDTGAKNVNFYLKKDALIFAHDGRPFNERDIKGITDIGEGSKSEDEDSIGQFGIGFKAVFAYTENPKIWSPTYSFEIKELVLPYEIENKDRCGERTCFEFPFNNPKKSKKNAFNEVKNGLNNLPVITLLFLSGIESIQWKIENENLNEIKRNELNEFHIELQRKNDNKILKSKHFLRFKENFKNLEKQYVSIAFNLEFIDDKTIYDPSIELHKQMKIVPASRGHVCVYFPAEKEVSGLRFHLHAPFVPELSRASIKDTEVNNPLYNELAKLAKKSLWKIHDLKLLTSQFLGVLPNNDDNLLSKYEVIKREIINEMNYEKLTPTFSGGFLAAKNLYQSKASLKRLLSKEDLNFLFKKTSEYEWAIGASQNSNVDKFLSSLMISYIHVEDDFIDKLLMSFEEPIADYFSEPSEKEVLEYKQFIHWFNNKDDAWYQRLYALLYSEDLADDVEFLPIVKLSNGKFDTGKKTYFPKNDNLFDNNILSTVDFKIYTSGNNKNEQENAKLFLESIGVSEIDNTVELKLFLNNNYTEDSHNPNIEDINYFIEYLSENPGKEFLFSSFFILKDNKGFWRRPCEIFLDHPFLDTGLSVYFKLIKDTSQERIEAYKKEEKKEEYYRNYRKTNLLYDLLGEVQQIEDNVLLSTEYIEHDNVDRIKLINFCKKVGVYFELDVVQIEISLNPRYDYLKGAPGIEFTYTGVNKDFTILGLIELLEANNKYISLMIWNLMRLKNKQRIINDVCLATYRYNKSNEKRTVDSYLICMLRDYAWVPLRDGSFVKPSEATKDTLPQEFVVDDDQIWLKKINFGVNVQKKLEESKEKEKHARELGFKDQETLNDAQRFAKLPPEVRERYLNEYESELELPQNTPKNPHLRKERVGQQAEEAPEDTKSMKQRSVSNNDQEVKQNAEVYLRHQYTNTDEEMICQICTKELPFKKPDGQYYFEKINFIQNLKKLYFQNYLALCPNHAAMFKVANESKDTLLDTFMNLENNYLEVTLAGKKLEIYFTDTHIHDMKTVINTDENEEIE